MKKSSADDRFKEFENRLTNNSKYPIILIGVGIFAWLGIGSFAYLFENTIKHVCFNIGTQNYFTIWFSQFIQIITYLLGVIVLIKLIKSNKYSELKMFKFAIGIFILGQLFQFIEPYINDELRTENYLDNSSNYYNFLKENPITLIVSSISVYLLYLLVGVLIFIRRK